MTRLTPDIEELANSYKTVKKCYKTVKKRHKKRENYMQKSAPTNPKERPYRTTLVGQQTPNFFCTYCLLSLIFFIPTA